MVKNLFLTLRKGLILDLCFTFFLDMRFVTMRGYLSIPAIRAWPKGLSEVPSSLGFTMIALRPANRPESTRTTLPCFIIFPILENSGTISWFLQGRSFKGKGRIRCCSSKQIIIDKKSSKTPQLLLFLKYFRFDNEKWVKFNSN